MNEWQSEITNENGGIRYKFILHLFLTIRAQLFTTIYNLHILPTHSLI